MKIKMIKRLTNLMCELRNVIFKKMSFLLENLVVLEAIEH